MLTDLRHQVEADYAGFGLEVTGARRRDYERAWASFTREAARAAGDDCLAALNHYVDWFHDPHLFVFQSGRLDTAETTRRAATVAELDLDEAQARATLERRAGHLDPIEGIWYDGALRVAVVPEPGAPAGRYVAVVLKSDTTTWRPGTIRARFSRRADGGYVGDVWARNYALRHLDARIHKHVLLRLSPGIWGRAWPLDSAESLTLDTLDVHRPTLIARDGAIVVSIPSHDPAFTPVLNRLIAANRTQLAQADRLVVDLRGNEGGSSGMSNSLLPHIMSEHRLPSPYPDFGGVVMLSSDDQMAYARRAFGSDTSRFVRTLLERMTAHPGELVPLNDPAEPEKPAPADQVIRGPRRVGVLIDGGTVSASEVLVLLALRSERATVFGQPTRGALDYQSVNVVPFAPGQRRWYLGYPTITASARLPEGGMRGLGIAPAVRLDLGRLADPIGAVIEALAREP